ncbi:hypothetical protein PF011_g8199, partial [Phytophthora fragariae]
VLAALHDSVALHD